MRAQARFDASMFDASRGPKRSFKKDGNKPLPDRLVRGPIVGGKGCSRQLSVNAGRLQAGNPSACRQFT